MRDYYSLFCGHVMIFLGESDRETRLSLSLLGSSHSLNHCRTKGRGSGLKQVGKIHIADCSDQSAHASSRFVDYRAAGKKG